MPTNSPLRLIWIAPKFPLGIPDGARHATRQLLRHLTQLGVTIDLVCLAPKEDTPDEAAAQAQLGVRSCGSIMRTGSKFWPLPGPGTPYTFRTFAADRIRIPFGRKIETLLAARPEHPDEKTRVVFDGLHAFAALPPTGLRDLAARCDGVIYRAHNFETALWDQCAERARTPWLRAFFRYQTFLVKAFERRIAEQVQWIAAVSEDDAVRFRALAPGAVATSIPIGMDFPEAPDVPMPPAGEDLKLLFLGRLDWLPNRSGLQWFLDTIWPAIRAQRPAIQLQIAGSGDGRWLARYAGLPGLELLGRVPDVEPLYRTCAFAIAPIFQGSGTRVKILEAARYQRAVLTTALGAEGTGLIPGTSYWRAETDAAWLSCLTTLTRESCQTMGLNAYHAIRQRFDGRSVAQLFLKEVSHRS